MTVFKGLKVLDVSSFIAGPGAAVVLSDFGADVIKIEPPAGDLQRLLSSVPPSPRADANYSWHLANRNKRGMAIDLKAPDATTILRRLVDWADVVITNLPHGARERLHLGYDEVAGWNPRVIYADVTGFGDAGPDAELPGFDLTAYWARSGLLSSTRDAGAPPTLPIPGSGDFATAIGIYAAIVTALYDRERTGKGASVGTSLLAAGVWAAGTFVAGALAGGRSYGLHNPTAPTNPLINPYRSSRRDLTRYSRATRSCASSRTGSCPPRSRAAACAPASTRWSSDSISPSRSMFRHNAFPRRSRPVRISSSPKP